MKVCLLFTKVYPVTTSVCPVTASVCPVTTSVYPVTASVCPVTASVCLKMSVKLLGQAHILLVFNDYYAYLLNDPSLLISLQFEIGLVQACSIGLYWVRLT
jgi:hypothetical protein